MRALIALVLGLTVGFVPRTWGEDLDVSGDVTLTDVTNTYESVTVTGSLTVGAGAKLVCTKDLLVSTGSLTVAGGGLVEVNGTATFAKAGGQATVTVAEGSQMVVMGVTYLAYGYDAVPSATDSKTTCRLDVSGTLELRRTAYAAAGNMVPYPGQYTDWFASVPDVDVDLWLHVGGEFRLASFVKSKPTNDAAVSATSSDAGRSLQQVFHFNGGRLVQYGSSTGTWFEQRWASAPQGFVRLVSEDGHDIELETTTVTSLFGTNAKTSTFALEGSGDLVKLGTGRVALSTYKESAVADYDDWNMTSRYGAGKVSRKEFTGAIRVKEGTLTSFRTSDWCDNAAPVRKIVIEPTGTFDVNGCDIAVTAFQGWGPLANTSETTATLTLDTGAADVSLYTLCPRLNVVHNGTGGVSACVETAGLGSITMNGGNLELKSRREFGYNFYRFRTLGARSVGVKNGQIRIREFYYLNGDTDVTAGYDSYVHIPRWTSYYTLAPAMWDRDPATCYMDQQAQNANALTWLYFTIGFKPARKVTGYKWLTDDQASCPTNWVFMANHTDSLSNYNNGGTDDGWVVLDRRCDDTTASRAETPTYALAYSDESAIVLPNVTLSDGARLAVAGANLTLNAATLGSAVVKASFGARLTLPTDGNQSVLEIDASADVATLVNFNPAKVGSVRVVNWRKGAKRLPLVFENLGSEANLSAWPVYLNDETEPSRYRVYLENGQARLRTGGTRLILR